MNSGDDDASVRHARARPGNLAPRGEDTVVAPAAVIASPAPQTERGRRHEAQRGDIAIEEEIGCADFPTAIRLADHCLWRLNEHVRAAKGAAS